MTSGRSNHFIYRLLFLALIFSLFLIFKGLIFLKFKFFIVFLTFKKWIVTMMCFFLIIHPFGIILMMMKISNQKMKILLMCDYDAELMILPFKLRTPLPHTPVSFYLYPWIESNYLRFKGTDYTLSVKSLIM